eukprot:4404780-Lingulodinium_polyedra.AAC.1
MDANNWHAVGMMDRGIAEFWFRFFVSQQERDFWLAIPRAWAGRGGGIENIHSDHVGTFGVEGGLQRR